MRASDYVQRTAGLKDRLGKPLEAPTKAGQITALRTCFRDCQEWEWLPRRLEGEQLPSGRREFAADQRLDDCLGEGEAAHAAREVGGAVEGERAPPQSWPTRTASARPRA